MYKNYGFYSTIVESTASSKKRKIDSMSADNIDVQEDLHKYFDVQEIFEFDSDNYSEKSSIREDVNSKLVWENDKAADSEKTL